MGNTYSQDLGNTRLRKEEVPMPWRGVTVSEQRQRFFEDYQLNYYSITELAERFSISRKTAHTHPGHLGKMKPRGQRLQPKGNKMTVLGE